MTKEQTMQLAYARELLGQVRVNEVVAAIRTLSHDFQFDCPLFIRNITKG